MSYTQSHKEKIGEDYDSSLSTDGLNAYMTVQEAKLVDEIIKSITPEKRDRYFDFACGTGRILSVIAPYFRDVVAVDVSENMQKEARKKVPDAEFHLTDLTTTGLDIGKFDLISAFRFFGNAEHSLRSSVLGVLREKIKDDGYLLFNNHRNPSSLLTRISGNRQEMDLTYGKMDALLRQHNFKIVKVVPIGVWVLRHKWSDQAVWDSPMARLAERLTNWSCLAGVAPDMIVLAQPV